MSWPEAFVSVASMFFFAVVMLGLFTDVLQTLARSIGKRGGRDGKG